MTDRKKEKILVIDDTPANIQMLGSLLTEDYQVIFAINGPDAIMLAEKELPDLILLDIMMPDMDGFAVCKVLKSVSVTKDIPIIFVTAMNDEYNESLGLELGAIDYITKPIVPAITKARVKNHLELKHYRDILKSMSTTDGLTGIPNRRHFDEHIAREWHRAIRYKSTLSLIIIDIDYFKAFNDQYGHMAGDICLKKVANELSIQLRRPTDIIARYGGEEFACVLPETAFESAQIIAEKMNSAISNLKIPHVKSGISEYVTISAGLSCIQPAFDNELDKLMEFTDTLLYKAKEEGRNRIIAKPI